MLGIKLYICMKLPSSSSQTGYECVKAYNTKQVESSFVPFFRSLSHFGFHRVACSG